MLAEGRSASYILVVFQEWGKEAEVFQVWRPAAGNWLVPFSGIWSQVRLGEHTMDTPWAFCATPAQCYVWEKQQEKVGSDLRAWLPGQGC